LRTSDIEEEEKGKDVSVQEITSNPTLPPTPALGQTLRMKEKQTC
jgi:hypothetical protein